MMRSYFIKLWIVALLVFVWGCASAPRKEARSKPSASCGAFCDEIDACAKQHGRSKYSPLLCGIARCETGEKCISKIDSPTGRYRGPFQFSKQTWRTRCYPVFNEKHLAACRNEAAMYDTCCSTICSAELVATSGVGDWPACGKRALSSQD